MGNDNLKVYISEYYKKLFGASVPNTFYLDENRINDIPQLSSEENASLTASFSVEEVYDAITQIELNKSPGPDGFPAEFYQKFWEVIKSDLMVMFAQLHQGNLPLYKMNFGVITLIPKKEDAVQIQQYRPICLLNASFRVFTKVAAVLK